MMCIYLYSRSIGLTIKLRKTVTATENTYIEVLTTNSSFADRPTVREQERIQ